MLIAVVFMHVSSVSLFGSFGCIVYGIRSTLVGYLWWLVGWLVGW